MRRSSSRRPPPRLAGVGVMLSLLVYLVPLYGAILRPGPGGAVDRTLGIVSARHRQAQPDAVSDDQPVPRVSTPALAPGSMPAVLLPEPIAGSMPWDDGNRLASHPPSSGTPRSPPAS